VAEGAHILVVDDEPQITRVLRTALVAQGYEIRVANDGEMALEIMKDWSPHLIITDLSMPYITKPFSMNELLARVRANLRRAPKSEEVAELVEIGDFRIDLATRTVAVAGRELKLTPKEFDLLLYLSQHPHRVVPHRTLLAAIWGANSTEQPEYLRVFIGQLRKKVEPDPAEPRYLLTERWVGYRFEPGN